MSNDDFWPFVESPKVAIITTRQVIEDGYPVLLVTHDSDGVWQFLCGTTDAEQDGRVIALREMLDHDPDLIDLADLPMGWRAWRDRPDSPWQRAPRPPEEQ